MQNIKQTGFSLNLIFNHIAELCRELLRAESVIIFEADSRRILAECSAKGKDFPEVKSLIENLDVENPGENRYIVKKLFDKTETFLLIESEEKVDDKISKLDLVWKLAFNDSFSNASGFEQERKQLIETINELMFYLDKFGYIRIINSYGAKVLGYLDNQLIGKHFLDLVDDDSKFVVADAFGKLLSNKEKINFDIKLVDKYGTLIDYTITTCIVKQGDEISGLFGYGVNLTEKKKDEIKIKELNLKLIEANRIIAIEKERAQQQISILEELNRLKNDFISNVSHELRTPLASIVGFAETIASDPDLPKDMIIEFSEIILSEGKRLAKLVNDILDFSKLESGTDVLNKTEFDIVLVLKDIISSFEKDAQKKNIELKKEIPEAEIITYADKERIVQVFTNILSNAIKFTENGLVTIIVRDFLNEFEVIINDTGIGIPEEQIPKLFQKFTKVDRPGAQIPGAGIGLTVTKQIVDMHKGLIRIKSEVNKGTSVIVRLPKL